MHCDPLTQQDNMFWILEEQDNTKLSRKSLIITQKFTKQTNKTTELAKLFLNSIPSLHKNDNILDVYKNL